ncbi:hypothetical protein B7463_g4744, partial [Scytalidium lignicola]
MDSSISETTSTATSPPASNDRPIRRRFATTGRVRSGCLTCKARKKKCDDQRAGSLEPCQSCVRLGLICERLPQRKVVLPQQKKLRDGEILDNKSLPSRSPSRSESPQPISGITCGNNGFMTLYSLDSASPERILLKYYVERLAPLCSILQHGGNEFRNVLLPMAIDDSSLLYALFTYASIHAPSSGPVPCITPHTRLRFESEAARGLAEAIRQNSVSESTIACALICSTAEVVSGDTQRWSIHLRGAGHLIEQLGGPERLRQTSDGRFLLRNFAYHDIMAALSTSWRPRFRGAYWIDDDSCLSPDCLMGIAHQILGHISDMCYFIADTNDQDDSSPAFASSTTRRGQSLAQLLLSQTLIPCTTLSGSELESLLHHAEAFRYAALLRLYRFLSRYAASSTTYVTQVSECVQSIMTHMYQVPPNLYCELGLVFPLFMAGIEGLDDKVKVSYIRNRLQNIESWTGFQHVSRVREVLESVWSTGWTDWETLLNTLDWQISLA